MTDFKKRLGRLAVGAVYIAFFAAILYQFFYHPDQHLQERFEAFKVPALGHPGGDARNIQLAAHCHTGDSDYCMRPVKAS
jgi:hypothetical protein